MEKDQGSESEGEKAEKDDVDSSDVAIDGNGNNEGMIKSIELLVGISFLDFFVLFLFFAFWWDN